MIRVLFIIGCFVFHQVASGKELPGKRNINKKDVVSVLKKVADWQIDHFTYKTAGSPGYLHDYGIDSWTNATLYLGMSRWAKIAGEPEYHQWLLEIGNANHWKVPANFENTQYGIYHADEICIVQFYQAMYEEYDLEQMLLSSKNRLDRIISHPPDTSMRYNNKQSWTWCDAIFMAPPAFAGMYRLTGDEKYMDFMNTHLKKTYTHLYHRDDRLFFRDDSYFAKKEANGQNIFWGRGNGWVAAGLVNILKILPETTEVRSFYAGLLKDLLIRLVELRDENGFWHASLLDPESYPSPETSATALITYALAYSVNNGLLDKKEYVPHVKKSWDALTSVVDENGKLGYVQPIGADPRKVTKEMTAVYGAGAFLMAGCEVLQFAK